MSDDTPSSPPPRRRVVTPEPTQLKRQEPREPFPLAERLDDAVVVPHTLAMLQDVEKVLSVELEHLRVRAEAGQKLDYRETARMQKLMAMLKDSQEMRKVAETREGRDFRKKTIKELMEMAAGKKDDK